MSNQKTIFLLFTALLVIAYGRSLLLLSDNAHLGMSLLFALGIGDSLTRFHQEHDLKFSQPVSLMGGSLVACLAVFSFKEPSFYLLRLMPFIGGIALVLLGFGTSGIRKYWRELGLLFFLGVPSVIVSFLPDPSPVTAFFVGGLLNLIGISSSVQGQEIWVQATQVSVFRGCSGLEYMTYLLGMSGIAMLLFPIGAKIQSLVSVIGILVGFVVNSIRVALLTLLVLDGNKYDFYYWHEGQGSLIFGAIAVLLFILIYWIAMNFRMQKGAAQEF